MAKVDNRKMKDSGIEWIGEIPRDWSIIKTKFCCREIYSGGTPSTTNNSYWDGNIPWIPSGKCHDCLIESYEKTITKEGLDNSSTKIIPPNTALMAMTGATCGQTGFLCFESCANQSVMAFIEDKDIINSKYLWYALQAAREDLLNKMSGGAQGGIDRDICKNITMPFTNLHKQNKTVEYIDKRIEKINDLIKNQEQQIEKLKEYKQSLITEVVTKGLDKNAKMKDSGVEWIEKIPKDWEVIKLKYAYTSIEQKYNSGEYPYIALENIEAKSGNYVETETNKNYSLEGTIIADKNAVIFGKLRPYLTKAFLITEPSCVSSEFAVFVSKDNSTEYLKYLFLSYNFIDRINSSTYGTKMPRANIDFIKNTYIALPNVKEQNKIVSFIKIKSVRIDNMINIKKEKIEKLNEYKKSLIYEYVTGKKEV